MHCCRTLTIASAGLPCCVCCLIWMSLWHRHCCCLVLGLCETVIHSYTYIIICVPLPIWNSSVSMMQYVLSVYISVWCYCHCWLMSWCDACVQMILTCLLISLSTSLHCCRCSKSTRRCGASRRGMIMENRISLTPAVLVQSFATVCLWERWRVGTYTVEA